MSGGFLNYCDPIAVLASEAHIFKVFLFLPPDDPLSPGPVSAMGISLVPGY